VRDEDDWIHYSSQRKEARGTFGFVGKYRGSGDSVRAEAGSLDAWLTERYCLYSANSGGKVFRGDIHHDPWPLERAEYEINANTLPAEIGVSVGDAKPLAHFARRLDVVAWPLKRID